MQENLFIFKSSFGQVLCYSIENIPNTVLWSWGLRERELTARESHEQGGFCLVLLAPSVVTLCCSCFCLASTSLVPTKEEGI